MNNLEFIILLYHKYGEEKFRETEIIALWEKMTKDLIDIENDSRFEPI